MAEVEKWGQDPVTNAKIYDIEMRQRDAERAKEQSALALAALTIQATLVLEELLQDEDPQVRARAIDLIYSRTIPKVAAKHMEDAQDTIDSADVASLRESIIARVKGDNQNGR